MSLRPKTWEEVRARQKRADERRRASVRRYEERKRKEVLEGKREQTLKSTTPIAPINRDRKKARQEAGEVYGPFHRHVSGMRCLVENEDCLGVVKGHHLKHVGNGGKDEDGEVPLCVFHHQEVHDAGAQTFDARHEVDLRAEADRILLEYAA